MNDACKVLTLCLGLAAVSRAVAVQNNWTGAGGDMLWTNSANWSLGVLPDSTQDVSIDNTGTNAVVLNAPAQAGSLALRSNAVLNLAGDLNVATSVAIDGAVEWTGGDYTVNGWTTVSSNGLLNIRTTGTNLLSASIVNNGTISCFTTNIPCPTYDYIITNNQSFIVDSSLTLGARLINAGTLRVPANRGDVMLALGPNSLRLVNRGTLLVETNSTLMFSHQGEGMEFQSGTVIDGAGVVRFFANAGGFLCSGDITVNGTVEEAGRRIFGSSIWSGPGVFRWLSGQLNGITFGANFHVELNGPDPKAVWGPCTNLGTCTIQTNCTMAAEISAGGFINAGTLRVPANLGEVTLSLSNSCQLVNSGTLLVETNSTLAIHPTSFGELEFQSGTIFGGAGQVRLLEYNFDCWGNITVNSTVELAGAWADPHLDSTWNGPGLFRWSSGSLKQVTFGPDLHVEISSTDYKSFQSCTNLGTVRWLTDVFFTGYGFDPSFNNLGLFILETNCTISDGIFRNAGTLRVPANQGDLKLSFIGGELANTGTLEAGANSTLIIPRTSNSVQFQSGTIFEGTGEIRLFNARFYCLGSMVVNGSVELAGDSAIYPAEFDNSGTSTWGGPGLFRWLGGVIYNVNFAPDFHVTMSGTDWKWIGGVCTNLGNMRCLENGPVLAASSEVSFLNGGLFTVEADGAWDIPLLFTNLAGGTFQQTAGQFSLGSFNNSGGVELLGGRLNVVSNFVAAPGSSCKVPLRGYSPGTAFGQLKADDLTLNGSLVVTLANGLSPTNGSAFVIATNGLRHGQFASTSLPPLASNLLWRVSYQPAAVTLQVISPPTLGEAAMLPDGSFQFTLTGAAGGTYEIQASTNLVGWVMVTNAPFVGAVTFTDMTATNFTQRFYRGLIHE